MRFEIDYARAKTMATRLQDFLAQNPKPKLSRSSSIEAVARILGFNSRNEMAARIEAAAETVEPASRSSLLQALEDIRTEECAACAKALVETARNFAPDADFPDAFHEDGPNGIHALLVVEEQIAEKMRREPAYRRLMIGAFASSVELDLDFECGPRETIEEAIAMAVVNEAWPETEILWNGGRKTLAEPEDEEAPKAAWDVDVECWLPGSLQVELPDGGVGEIDAQVLGMATIAAWAKDEDDALRRAQARLETENFSMIWNPRPDRGVKDVRWASRARDGDPMTYVRRDEDLVESHWSVTPEEAHDFRAVQIAWD